MKTPNAELRRQQVADLTSEEWRRICVLFDQVWPTADGPLVGQRAEDFRQRMIHDDREVFAAWAGEDLVALAMAFAREIQTGRGALRVMALAGVCCTPEWRGQGWGAAVVRAAFAEVDRGAFGLSLFQTGVPDFYRKIGAREVNNRFVNSRWREGDRGAVDAPWWDSHVMIYPAAFPWPTGEIDLLGTGY